MTGAIGGYEANKLEVASPERCGMLQALINTVAAFAGMVAVPVAAWIVDATGTWASALQVVAVLYCCTAAHYYRYSTCDEVIM